MTESQKTNLLYVGTILIELFLSSGMRMLIYYLVMAIPVVLLIVIQQIAHEAGFALATLGLILIIILGLAVAYGPLVFSLLAYIGLGSGHTITRFVLGARETSRRETEKIATAFKQILENTQGGIKGLSAFYIIDAPVEYMYLIGTTLYISSGAIDSKFFEVMLAHELGHAQADDGSKILALRRLVFPLFYIFISNVKDFSTNRQKASSGSSSDSQSDVFYSMVNSMIFFVLSWLGGGLGLWLLSWQWAAVFRQADYAADAFVEKVGMKNQLIEYLEERRFYDTSVPYMLGWQPANELRLNEF